ncbi:hypothetical protein OHC51_03720 [Stenotrophomonas indicatrix]|uniref:hypothetical protein n=1 Tax=Stenotrophomonas indicatrix TaxID=2045451 RepID=UPI0030097E06
MNDIAIGYTTALPRASIAVARSSTAVTSSAGVESVAEGREALQQQLNQVLSATVEAELATRVRSTPNYMEQSEINYEGARLCAGLSRQSAAAFRNESRLADVLARSRASAWPQTEEGQGVVAEIKRQWGGRINAALQAGGAQGLGRGALSVNCMVSPQINAESHYDFFEELMALLQRLQGEWLDTHEGILGKFVAFFDKLTNIMAKFADAVQGSNSDGELDVDTRQILDEIDGLMRGDLGLGGEFATHEEAQDFLDKLGLEGLEVSWGTPGPFQLRIKRQLLQDLKDAIPRLDRHITPARWNAIIAAKDSIMERFNHISRVMTEKYQRVLQLWDTLNKTLSGTIDAITEADRVYASNLT